MAEYNSSDHDHRIRLDDGLDLSKRKDREFYTELTRNTKMRRLWEERQRSTSGRPERHRDQ